jgi:hypothetical protein
LERAVAQALEKGARTLDLVGSKDVYAKTRAPLANRDRAAVFKILGEKNILSTEEMADRIIKEL